MDTAKVGAERTSWRQGAARRVIGWPGTAQALNPATARNRGPALAPRVEGAAPDADASGLRARQLQPATPAPAAELPASDLIRVPTRRLDAAQALALRLVEAILDVCGMPRAEAVSIMKQLIGIGAIEIP